jgi:hypothetical protein
VLILARSGNSALQESRLAQILSGIDIALFRGKR